MTDAVDGGDPDFGDLNFFSEKIDWNALEMELDRCMGCLDFRGLSSSFMMSRFLSTCLSVAREFVPLRKILPKHKHKIPKDRKILMRCRRKIIQQRAVATGGERRDALNRRLAETEKVYSTHTSSKHTLRRIGQLKTLSRISSSSMLMLESSPR